MISTEQKNYILLTVSHIMIIDSRPHLLHMLFLAKFTSPSYNNNIISILFVAYYFYEGKAFKIVEKANI